MKQLEIEKNQLQQNVFKLTETNKQLERDMLMIAPIVEEKDRLIGEQNNMIKQMRDQFETDKLKQREEYMRAFNRMKEELAMVRSSTSGKTGQLEQLQSNLAAKIQENEELANQVSLLEAKLKKLQEDLKNIDNLNAEITSLKDQIRVMDKQLFEYKIKAQDIESAYDLLKKEVMMAKSSSGSFEESLEELKLQISENERVIKTLTQSKSDLNSKISTLQKEKG